jgi:thiol-disulfide isomerase/thioredoxin
MKPRHFWLAAILMSTPWTSTAVATLPTEGRMPPLTRATAWLNSQPLNAQELRGKVVLVDFWTYTCINWLRTLPYLRAWAEKYRDDGLVVIGVHTPEFDFEKDLDNVRSQARRSQSTTRLLSTATTRSGMPSATSTGRRCISSMRTATSATINSAKAITSASKESFSSS